MLHTAEEKNIQPPSSCCFFLRPTSSAGTCSGESAVPILFRQEVRLKASPGFRPTDSPWAHHGGGLLG